MIEIEFATKLKNAVTAIKSFPNHLRYLYSSNLVQDIIRKLPSSMISNYVRFATSEKFEKPDLVKISEFLFKEAELNIIAGVNFNFSNDLISKSDRYINPRIQYCNRIAIEELYARQM